MTKQTLWVNNYINMKEQIEGIKSSPQSCEKCKIACITWRNYSSLSWLAFVFLQLKEGETFTTKAYSLRCNHWLTLKFEKDADEKRIYIINANSKLIEVYKFKEGALKDILENYLLVIPHPEFGKLKNNKPLCVQNLR